MFFLKNACASVKPVLSAARLVFASAAFDASPGGAIRLDYGNGNVMLGEVVELDPPRRLVFTWGWEDPAEAVRPGGSRVQVDLTWDEESVMLRIADDGPGFDLTILSRIGEPYYSTGARARRRGVDPPL